MNYPAGVTGSEPQIAGYPELDAILEGSTGDLLDELDRLALADAHAATITPESFGHLAALSQARDVRDELREAIRAELADRAES